MIGVSGRIFFVFFRPKRMFKNLLDQTHFILILYDFPLIFYENQGFEKSIFLRLYIGKISRDKSLSIQVREKFKKPFCSKSGVVFRNRVNKLFKL